jgi:hypothetical protein
VEAFEAASGVGEGHAGDPAHVAGGAGGRGPGPRRWACW